MRLNCTVPGMGSDYAHDPHIDAPDPIEEAIRELQEASAELQEASAEHESDIEKLKSGDYTFVKWHGAVGDGVTDDTEAIRAAFASGKSNIYFDRGTYKITDTIIIPSYTRIVGYNATIFYVRPDDQPVGGWDLLIESHYELYKKHICFKTEESNLGHYEGGRHITFEGLRFTDYTSEYNTLIMLQHAQDITIKNCTFGTHNGWHYIEINSSQNVRIEGCIFRDYPYNHAYSYVTEMVQINGAYSAARFGGRESSPGCEPFDNTPCQDIFIEGNSFYNEQERWRSAVENKLLYPAGIGSQVASSAAPHNRINVSNNFFSRLVFAIESCNMEQSVISDNDIRFCAGGIRFFGGTGERNVVSGNMIELSQVFENPDDDPNIGNWQKYRGISFEDETYSKVNDVVIDGNTIESYNAQGIIVTVNNSIVSNNHVWAIHREAIAIFSSYSTLVAANIATYYETVYGLAALRIYNFSNPATPACENIFAQGNLCKGYENHTIIASGTNNTVENNKEVVFS